MGPGFLGLRAAPCLGPMAAAGTEPEEPSRLSPKEEGELEDGEISDDDAQGAEGGGAASARPCSRRRPPPPGLRGGGSGGASSTRRFLRSRHQPPPELGRLHGHGHGHGHGGYRPKEPFRPHPPPPAPRLPPGGHAEPSPRPSFWERSHDALDRFRFRGRPYRPWGRWGRGRGNPPGRPPGAGGGPSFGCGQGWREPSPRKCILLLCWGGGGEAAWLGPCLALCVWPCYLPVTAVSMCLLGMCSETLDQQKKCILSGGLSTNKL